MSTVIRSAPRSFGARRRTGRRMRRPPVVALGSPADSSVLAMQTPAARRSSHPNDVRPSARFSPPNANSGKSRPRRLRRSRGCLGRQASGHVMSVSGHVMSVSGQLIGVSGHVVAAARPGQSREFCGFSSQRPDRDDFAAFLSAVVRSVRFMTSISADTTPSSAPPHPPARAIACGPSRLRRWDGRVGRRSDASVDSCRCRARAGSAAVAVRDGPA